MSIPVLSFKDENGNVHSVKAIRGQNAYQVAVAAGFEGSLQEWLDSLVGGSYDEQLDAIATSVDEIKTLLEKASDSATDTSDATATPADIRVNKSAYVNGNKIVGEVPARNTNDVTVNGPSVTVPEGIYDNPVVKIVDAVTQATPTIKINDAGLVTAEVTQAEGYVTEGTKSATKQLTTKGATTYTPSETDQIIPAGTYLTGAQTIKAMNGLTINARDTTIATNGKYIDLTILGLNGRYPTGLMLINAGFDEYDSDYRHITSIFAMGDGDIDTTATARIYREDATCILIGLKYTFPTSDVNVLRLYIDESNTANDNVIFHGTFAGLAVCE